MKKPNYICFFCNWFLYTKNGPFQLIFVMISSDPVGTREGHADADIRTNIRIYRAISDICRIMQISALMRIGKYIRIAIPSGNTCVC